MKGRDIKDTSDLYSFFFLEEYSSSEGYAYLQEYLNSPSSPSTEEVEVLENDSSAAMELETETNYETVQDNEVYSEMASPVEYPQAQYLQVPQYQVAYPQPYQQEQYYPQTEYYPQQYQQAQYYSQADHYSQQYQAQYYPQEQHYSNAYPTFMEQPTPQEYSRTPRHFNQPSSFLSGSFSMDVDLEPNKNTTESFENSPNSNGKKLSNEYYSNYLVEQVEGKQFARDMRRMAGIPRELNKYINQAFIKSRQRYLMLPKELVRAVIKETEEGVIDDRYADLSPKAKTYIYDHHKRLLLSADPKKDFVSESVTPIKTLRDQHQIMPEGKTSKKDPKRLRPKEYFSLHHVQRIKATLGNQDLDYHRKNTRIPKELYQDYVFPGNKNNMKELRLPRNMIEAVKMNQSTLSLDAIQYIRDNMERLSATGSETICTRSYMSRNDYIAITYPKLSRSTSRIGFFSSQTSSRSNSTSNSSDSSPAPSRKL